MKRLYFTFIFLGLFLTFAFFNTTSTKMTTKKPVIGILQLTSHPALDEIHRGILAGLKKEGFSDQKNIQIDFQNAQNDQSALKSISEHFVNEQSQVTIGIATPAAQALANATSQIPVIMGAISDPVGANLVNNLKHPDKNITGVMHVEPIAKQIKLIKQIMPNLKTIGVLYTSNDDSATKSYQDFKKAAHQANLKVKTYTISSTNDVAQVSAVMAQEVAAVYLPTDNTVASAIQTIIKNTDENQIPVFSASDSLISAGALATVSVSQFDLGELTGKMAAQILKGKKTQELPVQHVTKTHLVLNLKQAKKLHLTLPNELIQAATKKGEIIS